MHKDNTNRSKNWICQQLVLAVCHRISVFWHVGFQAGLSSMPCLTILNCSLAPTSPCIAAHGVSPTPAAIFVHKKQKAWRTKPRLCFQPFQILRLPSHTYVLKSKMLRFTSASLARTNLSAKIVTFLPETSSRGYNSCGNLDYIECHLTSPPLPILYIYIFVDVHVCSVSHLIHMHYFCFAMDRILYICRSKDVNKVTDSGWSHCQGEGQTRRDEGVEFKIESLTVVESPRRIMVWLLCLM